MQDAIAVVGPPASGKTELLRAYAPVVAIGEYAHQLQENHPLRQKCEKHWQADVPFSPELIRDLLREYPLPRTDWVFLDGTPRTLAQYAVVQERFNIRGSIIITIEDAIWETRQPMVVGAREKRGDSTVERLLQRNAEYKRHEQDLKQLPNVYCIDNSGPLARAQSQFDGIVAKIMQEGITHG